MELVKAILRAILAVLNPLKNDTAVQKAGSLGTGIAIAAGVVAVALQVLAMFPPAPPSAALPDVIPTCTDTGCPAPSPDAVEVAPPLVSVLAAALAAPFGCSGAQVQVWKDGLPNVAACLVNCGIPAGQVAITQTIEGLKIDSAGLALSTFACVMPCLARLGEVVAHVIATPGTRYGGSAGEANVYTPDRYSVVLTPRK